MDKRILVVDDEKDIVDLVKYNSQNEGYSVITARNGKEALDQWLNLEPRSMMFHEMKERETHAVRVESC